MGRSYLADSSRRAYHSDQEFNERPLLSNRRLLSSNQFSPSNHPPVAGYRRPQYPLGSKGSNKSDSEILNCNAFEIHNMSKSESWDQATTITTGTSQTSSLDNIPANYRNSDQDDYDAVYEPSLWSKFFSSFFSVVFAAATVATPILFIMIPRVLWRTLVCDNGCNGILITLTFKLLFLLVGCWALHFRKSRNTLPAPSLFKVIVSVLLVAVLAISWAFYSLNILHNRLQKYDQVVTLTSSLTDCLLFVHYLSVVLLELYSLRPEYVLKVVRSTDGESRFYSVGRLSVQNCAVWVLTNYYKDFPVYNPYLQNCFPSSKTRQNFSGFKLYDIDGTGYPPSLAANSNLATSTAMMAAAARRRDSSRNERFYEEQEYDRKVAKRKARLMVAAEEAFAHLRRAAEHDNPAFFMAPRGIAQAIFPSIARPLQKYFKITRQTHRHTIDAILDHLARCISLDFTAKAFLEKYLTVGPVISSEEEQRHIHGWDIISDSLLNRGIDEGIVFQLRQSAVSLIVYVAKVPKFYIQEQSFVAQDNRFVLTLQSETSV